MTSVSSISSTAGSTYAPIIVAPAATASGSSFSSTVSSATSTSSAPLQNPRVIDDPSAGIITEYLSANGSEVIAQTPTAVTVAYLRQGLTAQGLTKEQSQLEGVIA